METIISLIGVAGIGSLITMITQYFLNVSQQKKTKLYELKKLAYFDVIKASIAIDRNFKSLEKLPENHEVFTNWFFAIEKCRLFASEEVMKQLDFVMEDTHFFSIKRLTEVMRCDLEKNC